MNFAVWYLVLARCAVLTVSGEKLVLFLLDGFRWDYFDHFDVPTELPAFNRIFREGVKADYMKPTYPTSSYPNYYSMMTGLYPEHHGFVGNYMYDEQHNESFLIGTNKEQYHAYWWEDGEPLWVTAQKQNLRTSWYFWPGTEVTIFGINSTRVVPYTKVPTMNDLEFAIRSGVGDIAEDSMDLVGIYVERPDKYGHGYFDTIEKVYQVIREIDSKLQILLSEFDAHGLSNLVNVVIFSDHGMSYTPVNKTVNIGPALQKEDIKLIFNAGPYAQIWPTEGKKEKVYNALNNFHPKIHVFKKEDLPERYRLKSHKRTPPIWLQAELHWSILQSELPNKTLDPGSHGFDNEEEDMRAIFVATGPAFKENYKAKGFENINLYEMMCHILKIKPAKNDGNLNSVDDMLVMSAATGRRSNEMLTFSIISLAALFSLT